MYNIIKYIIQYSYLDKSIEIQYSYLDKSLEI